MILILVAVALVSFGLYGTSDAFHGGGAARCEGCHTMHNSLNGATMNSTNPARWQGTQYQAGPYLLQGDEPSDSCLNCHGTNVNSGSYHVSTPGAVDTVGGQLPNQMTPGGDFAWIRTTVNSVGGRWGHNILSTLFGYVQDPRLTEGPGGAFPANQLGCQSCHNPHGSTRVTITGFQTPSAAAGGTYDPIVGSGSYGASPSTGAAVGAYRLLGGDGYSPRNSGVTFVNNPPIAAAPSTYNRSEGSANGGQTRVAYGSGMSEWCANCHGQIHLSTAYVSGQAGLKHPAGNTAQLGAAIAANYNAYVGTGDLTGSVAGSYNSLVPFEWGETTNSGLATKFGIGIGAGPDATDNVQCLSCHRVHASAFTSMTRYEIAELVTSADGTYVARAGFTPAAVARSYNDRASTDFKAGQRQLCNKCHIKD
jgi:hypothetical protein